MTMEQMNFVEMDQMFFSGKKDVANGDGARFLLEVENNLLGSFSAGKYHIDERLCEQLVKLTKVYLYAFGDKVFCESFAKFKRLGKLQFVINVEERDKEQIATLCLLQDIKEGDQKKTAMTSLSTFKAPKSPAFFSDCFAKFNVFSKDDGGLANRDKKEDLSVLLARDKYLDSANQVVDASEQDFETLFNQKVELLKKYGVGKEILKQLEAEVAMQGGASKFGNTKHRHLNRILDRIIQKNMPEILAETMLSMQLTKLNNDFFENLSKKIEQKNATFEQVVEATKVVKATLDKAQGKTESKPSAPSKSSSAKTKSAKQEKPANAPKENKPSTKANGDGKKAQGKPAKNDKSVNTNGKTANQDKTKVGVAKGRAETTAKNHNVTAKKTTSIPNISNNVGVIVKSGLNIQNNIHQNKENIDKKMMPDVPHNIQGTNGTGKSMGKAPSKIPEIKVPASEMKKVTIINVEEDSEEDAAAPTL